jgi:hypothetical protein
MKKVLLGLALACFSLVATMSNADVVGDFDPVTKFGASNPSLAKAADAALSQLMAFTQVGDLKRFGFDRIPDRRDLTLLAGMREFVIQLKDIKTYGRGQNPRPLLRDQQRLLFPVVHDEEVRSAITLSQRSGTWQVALIGGAQFIRTVMRARLIAMSTPGTPIAASNTFDIVNVTGLNLYLISTESAGKLYFIPLFDRGVGIKAGAPILANDLLARLVPDAHRHNGQPT